jgi:hypothetical protein
MTLKAHFDGKHIVLDEPGPAGLSDNTPVTVVIGNGQPSKNGQQPASAADAFDAILGMAQDLGLPPDFAAQHDHYTKGLPKR